MNKKSLLLFLGVFQTMWLFAYNVTFQVDMQNVSGFTTPEVNGTFNGWCGNCNAMTDANADGIWETTIDINAGSYEYKFSYNNWAGQEVLTPGSSCTVTNSGFTNRSLTVSADVVLPVVCWANCSDCSAATPSYDVTFQVDMQNETGFSIPEVNGTFNGWCGNCNALSDINGDGIWETTITLPAGNYEYKFSHDAWAGQETLLEGSACTVTNSGFTNRALNLNADVVLAPVCYGSCNACNAVVSNYDVTFQVNMQNVTGFTTPEVNGTFNGWCGNCNAMSDVDGDGIWTVTVNIPAGNYEYKFAYDNWAGQETLIEGSSCTVTNSGFTNRTISVDADITLPAVCWESCDVCPSVSLLQMDLPVTFQDAGVDYGVTSFGNTVSTIVTDPTDANNTAVQVIKTATATTWAGTTITTVVGTTEIGLLNAIPLTPTQTAMSIRVWSPDAGIPVRLKVEDHNDPTHSVEAEVLTTTVNAWETLVYDFSNEANGTAPLNFTYSFDKASIFFNFGTDGATAGEKTYYFDDLMMYDGIVEPSTYAVTFQLDMQNVTGFTTPEVNGTFNGWCGNCNAMSDVDGDGIWTVTVNIAAGNYEYKFAYDNWAGQETLIEGGSCTITTSGFTNRTLAVSADVTLPVVCWASCNACNTTPSTYAVTFQLNMQNVTGFTTPEVNGTFNGWCGNCNAMSDVDGDGIWSVTVNIPAGNYEYKFAYDNWAGQETLIEGGSCTITTSGFTNRTISVDADITLPAVCWESCDLCPSTSLLQMDLPVTFEDAGVDYGVTSFGNTVSTIVTDPTDANNTAVQVIKTAAATTWAGTTITTVVGTIEIGLLNAIPLTPTQTTMSIRVWSPDAGIPVRLKVEDHNDPTHSVEAEVLTTTANAWETLVYDFSNEANGTAPLNFSYSFDKASIFFNFGTDGATAGEKTYYFDDLMMYDGIVEPSTYAVTFQLDMQNVTGFTTPEVNGTFNGWCGNCNAMSDVDGDGIWTVTVNIAAGNYEYKFAYDNWAGQETLVEGGSCTITTSGFTNRTLAVSADVTLPVVCWASCSSCNTTPASYAVTFQLDMQNVTGFTTPEVNGTFNGWCGNCNAMSDVNGDGIWTVTVNIPAGNYEYKFAYDNWAGQETLLQGSSCTVTNSGFTNRSLVVDADATLPVVCWASCTACNITPATYNVTFQLDMQNVTGFTTPEVNGTFNGWCGNCNAMSDVDGDGIWTVTVNIPAGNYEYKFAYDNWAGQETLIEGSSCTVTNSGFTNRSLVVDADATLPVVCWASCTACNITPASYNVTFQVDMQNVTGFTTPEVNGIFNGWCGSCTPMSDVDGDGIWTVTVSIPAGNYEYKFSYDNWTGQETLLQGSSCTVTNSGFTNRSLVVDADVTLPVVCWAACTSCETAPQYHSVTFQVDMQNISGFTTPEVNGTFNGWCGNCFQMSDVDGDGIWTATTQLQEGNYEYKFSYDAWAGQEELTPGSSCTVTNSGFTNRALQLLSDTTLNVVCWASCSACVEPTPVAVTFQLDATQVAGTTEAAISGSFNAYCADCAPMTLNGGIWSSTQMLIPGVYEYYFTLNNGATAETLQDGICTVNNNNVYHRIITVTDATTVDVVCFNSCSACIISVEEIDGNDLLMFPNPANNELHVQGTAIADGVYTVRNAAGQLVENGKTYHNQNLTVQVSRFESGVYTISIPTVLGMTNKTFVVLR